MKKPGSSRDNGKLDGLVGDREREDCRPLVDTFIHTLEGRIQLVVIQHGRINLVVFEKC